eukprot:4862597-Prymnesium_polylepis.1
MAAASDAQGADALAEAPAHEEDSLTPEPSRSTPPAEPRAIRLVRADALLASGRIDGVDDY